jgi:hypothetical protein
MKEHAFTLILGGVDMMTEDLSNQLFAAGCDDGSPYSSGGIVGVRFHRQAATLEEAIRSAIRDVARAGLTVARLVIEHDELASI